MPKSERNARAAVYLLLAVMLYGIWNGDMIRAAIFNQ